MKVFLYWKLWDFMSEWIDRYIEENRNFRYLYEKYSQYGTTVTGKKALASLKKMQEYSKLAYAELSKSVKAIKKTNKNEVIDKLLNIKE